MFCEKWESKQHYYFFFFKKGKNVTQIQKRFVQFIVNDLKCQKCFSKFCAGDFLLNAAARTGKPVNSNQMET